MTATTSNVAVTPGSGKNVATYSFSEDAVTKESQRVTLNTSAGVEIDFSGASASYPLPATPVLGALTTAMTDTSDHTVLAAPGASLRNYITCIIVSNSHATVGTDVVLKDGTAGTVIATIPAAAVYGGAAIALPTPLKQPTLNTLICAANLTTGASVKVTLVGYSAA